MLLTSNTFNLEQDKVLHLLSAESWESGVCVVVSKGVRMCIDDCKVIQVQVFFCFFFADLVGICKIKGKKTKQKTADRAGAGKSTRWQRGRSSSAAVVIPRPQPPMVSAVIHQTLPRSTLTHTHTHIRAAAAVLLMCSLMWPFPRTDPRSLISWCSVSWANGVFSAL